MTFRGMFPAGQNEASTGSGKRPVIFDILAPDLESSLLPEGIKLVLFTNPKSMSLRYETNIQRIQTRGGFVEQNWGDAVQTISFDQVTGGFMRLYTGLIGGITSPALTGGTRRESLAYDSYLDLLSLFHNNASIYDLNGQVVAQGQIKITFDGGVYLGWFNSFNVTENAEKPFQFTMTSDFIIAKEIQTWRSVFSTGNYTPPTINSTVGGLTTNSEGVLALDFGITEI